MTPDQQQWVRQALSAAAAPAKKIGCDPAALVAIAAVESGYGEKVIRNENGVSSHNLFGIKADAGWHGKQACVLTHEYHNGRKIRVAALFRSYPDEAAAWRDFGDFFLRNQRYKRALASAGDPVKFIHEIGAAGYSTNPGYSTLVEQVYQQIRKMEEQQ